MFGCPGMTTFWRAAREKSIRRLVKIPSPPAVPIPGRNFQKPDSAKVSAWGHSFGVHRHKKKGSPMRTNDGLLEHGPQVFANELIDS
jgi:hypothetical protein